MSKRIVRIAGHTLRPSIESLTNRMIHVVLRNGNTFYGNITAIDASGFTLTDQRTHKHHFSDKDLYEILYDRLEPS
ncbi:hypothetical protein [Dyadobacter tibetensis]|uniref:hypothetical protein n=1 Tax=Dyadobacter tibetensis TaxID=1211851 RepID=UPI00047105D1|nr:hypothetical protein [Dyadobacter tibetensis]